MNELSHQQETGAKRQRDWRKSMSDNVAYALLVYTALQIFLTVKAISSGSSSIMPYVALIILVAGIVPACRWFEKRWAGLTDDEAADMQFAGSFRRDQIGLWMLAICLPIALTAIFKAVL